MSDTATPPPSAASHHFDLCMVAALARVVDGVTSMVGSRQEATRQFPFLGGVSKLLERPKGESGTWDDAVVAWERDCAAHLPLRAVCEGLRLDARGRSLVLAVGLAEEDARFGALYDGLQETDRAGRPTVGTLLRWWSREWPELRATALRLVEVGLLEADAPELPLALRPLRVPSRVWGALRGEAPVDAALRLHASATLPAREDVVLGDGERARLDAVVPLLARGEVRCLVVRGHRANGRRALLGAVARSLGRAVLALDATRLRPDDVAWRSAGLLATALRAMPVVYAELGPGERLGLPALAGYDGPVGVVVGNDGSLEGPLVDASLTLSREIPDEGSRRALWGRHLALDEATLDTLAARYRLASGVITRVAALATLHARARALASSRDAAAAVKVTLDDVKTAYGELPRDGLELLTSRVPVEGDWESLSVAPATRDELLTLERWCRQRERVRALGGAALRATRQHGVRALFQGASGTGKTLAARVLASVLGKALYRVDLAAVVNKYIGETEKNLHQVFSRAEEMDVVLLLDEGDALMGRRTAVQSANDRYANLETNYLLQRVESFQGVLVVTTNAADHIDAAFARRMDVIVDFRAPDLAERLRLWELHLPDGHEVGKAWLREVAERCLLSGGQVRNVALHATLLALEHGGKVGSRHLEDAIFREYRRLGALCPLTRGRAP